MKRITSIMLTLIMIIGLLPVVIMAGSNEMTFTDDLMGANTTVTIVASGADVVSHEYDAGRNVLSLVVKNLTETSVKLDVTSAIQCTPNPATVNISNGSGSANLRFFVGQPNQGETVTVNVTATGGFGFTADLSEDVVKYSVGAPADALVVEASSDGSEEITYQWYSNTVNSTDGATAIEGATSASYTPSTEEVGTTYYYVVASCGELASVSRIAVVTVRAYENTLPALKDKATETVSMYKGSSYTWTMSNLFTDVDEDSLMYKAQLCDGQGVAVGEEELINSDSYTYTPADSHDGYNLKFYASDDGGNTWSDDVYTAVITVCEKQEYIVVTNDTDVPNRYLSRITECVITGPTVISAEVTNAGTVWNVTLPSTTNKSAEISYGIKVAGDKASSCYVSFNGAGGVKVSNSAISFSGVPAWTAENTATVTFQTRYNNKTSNASRMRTYTLNLTIDDGINDAPFLKGDSATSYDMRVGEVYSLDLSTVFGDKDSANVNYEVSVNGTEAVTTEKNYTYTPDKAGTITLAFRASDGELTSDTYTVALNVRDNAAPMLKGESSGMGEVCNKIAYTMNLNELFADADGDALTYNYTVNGGKTTSTPAAFSYTPAEVGSYTFVITATDEKGATSPEYTFTLSAKENPAPVLSGDNAKADSVNQYSAWTINLAPLFTDNAGDSLVYTVSIDGADAVSASATYSMTPDTDGEKTLIFYAVDKAGNVSPAYTVTLTVNYVARTMIATNCQKASGAFDGWMSNFTVTGAEIIEYKWRTGSGHNETDDKSHEVYIILDPATADNAVLNMGYSLSGGKAKFSTAPSNVTLENGSAQVKVSTVSNTIASWVTNRNYTLYFTNKTNIAPVASSLEGTFEAFVSEDYEIDLSTIFSDADNHPMTYSLSVNGGDPVEVSALYSEKLDNPGTFTYVFTATDIWGATATYTVSVTAKISDVSYNVTVNVPEGIAPTFYYTEEAKTGTELSATANGNTYTVNVPDNISLIAWRADNMGMSAAVSAQQNTLTIFKTDYVVKAGDEKDTDAVVTVKYGDLTAYGKNNSFLLLSTGVYTVSATVSSGMQDAWRSVELAEQSAVSGETIIRLEYRGVGITVPDFAEVFVCRPTERQGVKPSEIRVSSVEDSNVEGCKTHYYVLNNGTIYEYRVYVPENNENSGQYVPFVGMFKKQEDSSLTVTAEQLENGENGRKTVDHIMTPYTSEETLDMANVADLYMNVNAQGYLKMSHGQTKDLYTARSWWATNCGGWAMDTYYFLEPDYHYTVVDLNGQACDDVVTVDGNGKIRAVGNGTAIVLVTYDAMNVDIDDQLYREAGPESPTNDGFYSAIWPENTGVFVVSVGAEDSGITTGMTINENKPLTDKTAGTKIDAELDVIYFVGNKGEYTFTPATEGVNVFVANPSITGNVLSFNGFTKVVANNDGSVTVPLTPGRNIVRVEKDGKYEYQVITAKSVSVTVNGVPLAEASVAPGDNVSVVFDTLYTPVNRMALYNTGAAVVYSGVSGYPGKTAGNYRGGYGFYFFASHAPHQTVETFNDVSVDNSGYGNNSVTAGDPLVVPADFAEPSFTLSDGAFSVGGFSKFNMGDHRTAMGQAPSSGGSDNIAAFFGRLPDIEIPAAMLEKITITQQPATTVYSIGDVFNSTGMVVTATYKNSNGEFEKVISDYSYDTSAFSSAGSKNVEVSYTFAGKTVTTDVVVTVNEITLDGIEVTTMPAKTAYRIGEEFAPAGMVISAVYSDGSKSEITDYSYVPATISKDTKTVMVTYGEMTVEVPVTVLLISSIKVTTPPAKTNYIVDERFNAEGMVITAVYEDGSEKILGAGEYTFEPSGHLTKEDTNVTITYTGDEGAGELQPVTVDITVKPEVVLSGIEVTTMPAKTEYRIGEEFAPAGMVISAVYSDGSKSEITDYSYAPATISKDTKTVTVTYGEMTVEVPVTVLLISSIKVTTPPAKTNYIVDERFNAEGMVITAIYEDGSEKVLSAGEYTYEPSGYLTKEDTNVTITYKGNEDASELQSVVVGITVTGGSYVGPEPEEPNKPEHKTIEAYVSYAEDGKFVNGADGTLLNKVSVTVVDNNDDGYFTMGEAFIAFHEKYYSDGVDGYTDNGNLVTYFWGDYIGGLSYVLNNNWVNGIAAKIDSGDNISAFRHKDHVEYSDLFTWFEKDNYSVQTNQKQTFTVYGLNVMSSGENKASKAFPAGATVTVYDGEGNALDALCTTTDTDGKFSITFSQTGSYTIEVNGTCDYTHTGEYGSGNVKGAPIVPSRCIVEVTQGGGSIGGGGSAGSSSNNTTNKETSNKETSNKETSNMLTPGVSVNSSGEAKVEIKSKDVTNALTQAKKDNADVLEIAPIVKGDVSKVEVKLPQESLSKVAANGLGLNVNTSVADVKLPEKTVTELAKQKGELNVTASSDKDGNVSIVVSVGGKSAEKLEGGLRVVLPEEKEGKVMVIVNADGSETIVTKHITADGEHQAMLPGSATIKMIDNHKEFTDSKGHWGEGSINFVTERELYQGVGDGRFDTEGNMTRAMLVTVLYRLEGEVEVNQEHSFTDVSDGHWYADAVAWANANDIVKGVTGNSFAPDAFVTREQVATILYRYAQYLNMTTHHTGDLSQFADHDKTSEWAIDAKSWAVGAGIINGKPGNILDANGNATRAEVAAIIERLVTLMVK